MCTIFAVLETDKWDNCKDIILGVKIVLSSKIIFD